MSSCKDCGNGSVQTITPLPNGVGNEHIIDHGSWGIVVPASGESGGSNNLFLNPASRPYGASPINISGVDITRVRGISPNGNYAWRFNDTNGWSIATVADLSPGDQIQVCFGLNAPCGSRFTVSIQRVGSSLFVGESKEIVATGCWQTICLCAQIMTEDPVELAVTPSGAQVPYFAADFIMIRGEGCGHHRTYFDGDTGFFWEGERKFPGIDSVSRWIGSASSSASSISRFSRAAGVLRTFDELGFHVFSINGGEFPSSALVSSSYAALDGSYAQGLFFNDQTISFTGRIYGDQAEQNQKLSKLIESIRFFHPSVREPLQLKYFCRDNSGIKTGEDLTLIAWPEIPQTTWSDVTYRDVVINFQSVVPFWLGATRNFESLILAGGTNRNANASGAATYRIAYCLGHGRPGAESTTPRIILNGPQGGGGEFTLKSITNNTTGDEISFSGAGLNVTAGQVVVINLDPTSASVIQSPLGTAINRTSEVEGPGLSEFRLAVGYNNITFDFSSVQNPSYATNTPLQSNQIPARFQFIYREHFLSYASACSCPSAIGCNPAEIESGFLDFGTFPESPL